MESTENWPQARGRPRFLVVVGGSAGSIEVLQTLLGGLPGDLPASVLVVVHVAPGAPSVLDQILDRAGPLRVTTAQDGEPIEPGHVYVAPPDRHLILQDGHVRTIYGPRQNRARPAIDPLFSSAAQFDGRVIAVILSGMLDDGTMGALLVKEAGGTVIVQSPADAAFPSMPTSAIAYSGANYVLPTADIPGIITALVSQPAADPIQAALEPGPVAVEKEVIVATSSGPAKTTVQSLDVVEEPVGNFEKPFALVCPECGGSMIPESRRNPLRFRCFLGHAYTSQSLWQGQIENAENHLWSTLRVLEETAFLGRQMVDDARASALEGSEAQIADLEEQVANVEQRIETIRSILGGLGDAHQTAGQAADSTAEVGT